MVGIHFRITSDDKSVGKILYLYHLFSLSQGMTVGLGITAVISLSWGWGKGSLSQITVIESVIGHH